MYMDVILSILVYNSAYIRVYIRVYLLNGELCVKSKTKFRPM